MKTISIRLYNNDLDHLKDLHNWLDESWIEKPTTSEIIRYAIYDLWCTEGFPFYDECDQCKREHFKKEKEGRSKDVLKWEKKQKEILDTFDKIKSNK